MSRSACPVYALALAMSKSSERESPRVSTLSFIHNLQMEMKSEMSAIKQCLDVKPAFPKRFPTGRPITTTAQIASQLGYGFPESSGGHVRRIVTCGGRNQSKQILFHHDACRTFWVLPCQAPQLQQTHG